MLLNACGCALAGRAGITDVGGRGSRARSATGRTAEKGAIAPTNAPGRVRPIVEPFPASGHPDRPEVQGGPRRTNLMAAPATAQLQSSGVSCTKGVFRRNSVVPREGTFQTDLPDGGLRAQIGSDRKREPGRQRNWVGRFHHSLEPVMPLGANPLSIRGEAVARSIRA